MACTSTASGSGLVSDGGTPESIAAALWKARALAAEGALASLKARFGEVDPTGGAWVEWAARADELERALDSAIGRAEAAEERIDFLERKLAPLRGCQMEIRQLADTLRELDGPHEQHQD